MPVTKNQSKLSKLSSKLNPNTPIKKFFLFIVVFALLGGGYFAYKSFAGTKVRTWTAADSELKTEESSANSTNISYATDPAIGDRVKTVRRLSPKTSSNRVLVNARLETTVQLENKKGVPYKAIRACVWYKGRDTSKSTPGFSIRTYFYSTGYSNATDPRPAPAEYGYTKQCDTIILSYDGKTLTDTGKKMKGFHKPGDKVGAHFSWFLSGELNERNIYVWKTTLEQIPY